MINEILNKEISNEEPKVAELISAAESFLTNPLTSTNIKDDGSTQRSLATGRVESASTDPIELTSVTIDSKTSYTLTKWDDLHPTQYTWSSDPKETITSAVPDKTGLMVPQPANNIFFILSDLKRASERFELAATSKTDSKSRIKSILGKLGNKKASKP